MRSERRKQIYLPVSINITDKKILIIGGGTVASHKLATLLKFTTSLTVLAPEINEEIQGDRRLLKIRKSYEKDDLNGYHLIYACTNSRVVNAEIKEDAGSLGLLVNVADDPDLCDFISPAVYKNREITVSVSSNAMNVKKAVRIRNWISEKFEDGELDKSI